jgi:hypothetical protein
MKPSVHKTKNVVALKREDRPNEVHLTDMRFREVSRFPCRNIPSPCNPLAT